MQEITEQQKAILASEAARKAEHQQIMQARIEKAVAEMRAIIPDVTAPIMRDLSNHRAGRAALDRDPTLTAEVAGMVSAFLLAKLAIHGIHPMTIRSTINAE